MYRAIKPAKLHAFERFIGARAIIKQQKNSGANLDDKQKERDASEEIPVRKTVNWNSLLFQRADQVIPMKTLTEPGSHAGEQTHVMPPAFGSRRFRRHAHGPDRLPAGGEAGQRCCDRSGRTIRCGKRTKSRADHYDTAPCSLGACK